VIKQNKLVLTLTIYPSNLYVLLNNFSQQKKVLLNNTNYTPWYKIHYILERKHLPLFY